MHLLIATDAWRPQVNGVVTTLMHMRDELAGMGIDVTFITPDLFRKISCPGYPELKLALARPTVVSRLIDAAAPDWIHIATEGPIGWAARRHCMMQARVFTTSYHTRFPEYAAKIAGVPAFAAYWLERRFHGPSSGVMVATGSFEDDLRRRRFKRLMRWSRGVDVDRFQASPVRHFGDGPVFLCVGRVSREKNIEVFLKAALSGRKVVVGDGPQLARLKQCYPEILFTSAKFGLDLAEAYASADVFVFPSRTDTFGLILLEAMASGLPVAAYPVTGPVDIVENEVSGILTDDIAQAACLAIKLDREAARSRALTFSWRQSAMQFLDNVSQAQAARNAQSAAAKTVASLRSQITTRLSTHIQGHDP